jgi:hypothetical protein
MIIGHAYDNWPTKRNPISNPAVFQLQRHSNGTPTALKQRSRFLASAALNNDRHQEVPWILVFSAQTQLSRKWLAAVEIRRKPNSLV